jgi:hypothetical protein
MTTKDQATAISDCTDRFSQVCLFGNANLMSPRIPTLQHTELCALACDADVKQLCIDFKKNERGEEDIRKVSSFNCCCCLGGP